MLSNELANVTSLSPPNINTVPGVYSASATYFSAKSAYVACSLEPALNVQLPVKLPAVPEPPVVMFAFVI